MQYFHIYFATLFQHFLLFRKYAALWSKSTESATD